jgi:hypothetical protein
VLPPAYPNFSSTCIEMIGTEAAMDVGGEYSGTVSGVMNMAGSLAVSVSPIIFGFLVQRRIMDNAFLYLCWRSAHWFADMGIPH